MKDQYTTFFIHKDRIMKDQYTTFFFSKDRSMKVPKTTVCHTEEEGNTTFFIHKEGTFPKGAKTVICPYCHGDGLIFDEDGEPDLCDECNGYCEIVEEEEE